MDNKAMALTVNTFDDLLNMNADMHDSNAGLAVSRETNKIPSNLLAKREKSGSAFSTGIPLF